MTLLGKGYESGIDAILLLHVRCIHKQDEELVFGPQIWIDTEFFSRSEY
jgi:hypothetical protein